MLWKGRFWIFLNREFNETDAPRCVPTYCNQLEAKRKIGIMGGSFNPVHIGHLIVADYVCQVAGLDEVWLTLSPMNPLKASSSDLVDDELRLEMLKTAVTGSSRLRVCDTELSMPRPSYTIDTLRKLSAENLDCEFSLIIGTDNWQIFDKWRAAREIIDEFGVWVYPRPGYEVDELKMPCGVKLIDAPKIEISSTGIRRDISAGMDVGLLLPHGVNKFIISHNLYNGVPR